MIYNMPIDINKLKSSRPEYKAFVNPNKYRHGVRYGVSNEIIKFLDTKNPITIYARITSVLLYNTNVQNNDSFGIPTNPYISNLPIKKLLTHPDIDDRAKVQFLSKLILLSGDSRYNNWIKFTYQISEVLEDLKEEACIYAPVSIYDYLIQKKDINTLKILQKNNPWFLYTEYSFQKVINTLDNTFIEKVLLLDIRKTSSSLHMYNVTASTSQELLTAIVAAGSNLKLIPTEFRTYKLCKIAVSNSGSALRYVPDDIKDQTLCNIAIDNAGSALRYVPDDIKDQTLCNIAIDNAGSALRYVPDRLRNKGAIMKKALQSDIILKYIDTKKS